jgi:hypothetical protein
MQGALQQFSPSSPAMYGIEPGISGFPDMQWHIRGSRKPVIGHRFCADPVGASELEQRPVNAFLTINWAKIAE